MPAPMSLDLRQHFIDACLQKDILGKGRWLKDLTSVFNISYNTGRNWWNRYKTERSIQPRKVVIRRPNQKVTPEIIAYVRKLYEDVPSMRRSDVLDHIEGQFDVRISSATLHKIRFKLGLTYKKKRVVAREQLTPENELVRYEFSKNLLEQKPENLVFVDESGIKTGAGVNWGWSYSGNRLVEVRPKNQSKNLSMVVAIAAAGVLAAGCKLGSINGETFEGWVQEVLAPVLKPGQIVIMDNAPIHNRKSVEEAIEKVGAKLWYQPAYSPEFNAAEEWWAEAKGVAKRQVTDLGRKEIEELRRCVDFSMRWCSKANTEAYVRHVFEYARMTVVKYEARMMTNAA